MANNHAGLPAPSMASKRIAHNVMALAGSTMLARGVQFIWALLLARLLGEAGYGVFGVISGMLSVAATLPEFGIGLIVLRDVSQNRSVAGRYLRAALLIQPALSVVAYIGVLLAGLLLPDDGAVRPLLLIAGLSLIVDVFGNIAYNQLLAAEVMVTTSLITMGHILLQIALGLFALAGGYGLPGLYIATISASFARFVWLWLALRRLGVRPEKPTPQDMLRYLFLAGLPLAAGSFFTLIYQHINRLLVYTNLSDKAAGNLFTAFTIVFGVVELANTALLVALFPMMSRTAKENPARLQAITDQLAYLTLVLTLPIGIGISALAEPLSRLLFPGFASSAVALQTLIWHAVVMMVGNAYAQAMIIRNRQGRKLLINMAGLALNIVLNLYWLPRLGVAGAGVAIFIAQLAILGLFLLTNPPAQPWRLAGRSLRVLLAGGWMAVALLAVNIFFFDDPNPIVAGIVAAIAYGLGLLATQAFNAEDRRLIAFALGAIPVVGRHLARLFAPANG
jgi:O-antigen/teichoic acid export membrane protein